MDLLTDNWLPAVSDLLQRAYREQRRDYLATTDFPWPARRSRKRKPYPGVLDVVDDSEG